VSGYTAVDGDGRSSFERRGSEFLGYAAEVGDADEAEGYVVAVVVRYYGGTKLGYGGLVGAYSDATKAALGDAGTREAVPRDEVRVEVGYDDSGTVRGVVESEGVGFDAEYGERVVFVVRPPTERTDEVVDRLMNATSGRADIER
jgi:putative IMPACT (imprinted ancient) family translation regulator